MVIWVGQDRVRIAYSTIGRTFLIMSTAPAGSSLREYMRYAATIVALLPVRTEVRGEEIKDFKP